MRLEAINRDHLGLYLRKGRDYTLPLSKLRNYQTSSNSYVEAKIVNIPHAIDKFSNMRKTIQQSKFKSSNSSHSYSNSQNNMQKSTLNGIVPSNRSV